MCSALRVGDIASSLIRLLPIKAPQFDTFETLVEETDYRHCSVSDISLASPPIVTHQIRADVIGSEFCLDVSLTTKAPLAIFAVPPWPTTVRSTPGASH